jgi:hypothetical protein
MKKIIFLLLIVLLSGCPEATEFGAVYGIVTDYDTGEPLDKVTVELRPEGTTQTTKADGYFDFDELDPQQYTITVYKPGYRTEYETVTILENDRQQKNMTMKPDK